MAYFLGHSTLTFVLLSSPVCGPPFPLTHTATSPYTPHLTKVGSYHFEPVFTWGTGGLFSVLKPLRQGEKRRVDEDVGPRIGDGSENQTEYPIENAVTE
jgi:hypothetical protein